MAAADPPLVRVRLPGPLERPIGRRAHLTGWHQQRDGTWLAAVTWDEPAGDGYSMQRVETRLPAEYVHRIKGQDYRAVERHRYVPGPRAAGDWWQHRAR